MLGWVTWLGLAIFSLALSYDFISEWLSPRLLSKSWFPGEPDLPPVAGEGDGGELTDESDRVVLALYGLGVSFLFIGLLDASPMNPGCLPYESFIREYVVRLMGAVTVVMWYSEGQDIVIPYHSEVRYTIGLMTLVIPLYIAACGSGVL